MTTTKFTEEHEWLKIEDDGLVTVGITDFAQDQLGDVVYVGLPTVGDEIEKGKEAAVVESVKTASEINMPATGVITAVNTLLEDEAGKVNAEPMGDGWFFKFKVSDVAELNGLLDEAGYKAFLDSLG